VQVEVKRVRKELRNHKTKRNNAENQYIMNVYHPGVSAKGLIVTEATTTPQQFDCPIIPFLVAFALPLNKQRNRSGAGRQTSSLQIGANPCGKRACASLPMHFAVGTRAKKTHCRGSLGTVTNAST